MFRQFFLGIRSQTCLLFLVLLSSASAAQEYVIDEIQFNSRNTILAGSVVRPAIGKAQAAVVFVHGSGPQSRNLDIAKRFADEGIIALVYDKRGVGKSAGDYESKQSVSGQNIDLLADDSLAAANFLSSYHASEGLDIGLSGISQAGWIVPLAAKKDTALEKPIVDFMLIWSGPVCKVSEEDIFSKYTADSDSSEVPSYQEALNARKRAYVWPAFLGRDTDSSEDLAILDIPGLWIFGKDDGSIPVDLSMQKLSVLEQAGKPYQSVLFSSSGHNNMTETFATATDWVRRLQQ